MMKTPISTAQQIEAILGEQFAIKANVQIIPVKGENRILYLMEHISTDKKATIDGLRQRCLDICRALDATLYGTVNIDFVSLGDQITFDMMAEIICEGQEE